MGDSRQVAGGGHEKVGVAITFNVRRQKGILETGKDGDSCNGGKGQGGEENAEGGKKGKRRCSRCG